jgi:3-hydroxybutyrate dehydrogenase
MLFVQFFIYSRGICMTDKYLAGRTALVTGSAQGIGLAVAIRLAQAGANIVIHGLATPEQAAEAKAVVTAAGAPDVLFSDADVSKPEAIGAMMDQVIGWKGGLDILVNNAGIQHTASVVDMPAARWDAIIAINLSSAFHTMQKALPGMISRGYGRVVNIASVHGLVASANKGPYVAAKFGLVGLSKVAALECAAVGSRESGGVTVNCIAPGWTETALILPQIAARAAKYGGDLKAGEQDLLREKQPSLRTSQPSEIGEVAAMLCQTWAHNINGVTLPVDGGWTSQ